MQKIRTRVANNRTQVVLCGLEILLAFLHPVEPKRHRMILETVEAIHPGGLMRKRNFSKADECDLRAMGHQTRNQFARVRPHSAERVSRYQYTHRTPGESRPGNCPRPACDQCMG